MVRPILVVLALLACLISFAQQNNVQLKKIDSIHQLAIAQDSTKAAPLFKNADELINSLNTKKNEQINLHLYYQLISAVRNGQNKKGDSIFQLIQTTVSPSDTLLLESLNYRANHFRRQNDLKNTLATYTRLMSLAEKREDPYWLGKAHFYMSFYYSDVNNDGQTLHFRKKALNYYDSVSNTEAQKAMVWYAMAPIYASRGQIDSAITAVQRSLELDRTGLLNRHGSRLYNRLALMHFHSRNVDSAQYYLTKYINASKHTPDSTFIYKAYGNKAMFAARSGNRADALKYLDTATTYFTSDIENRDLFNVRQFYYNKITVHSGPNKEIMPIVAQMDSIIGKKYENKVHVEIDELKASFKREANLEQNETNLKKSQTLLITISSILLLGIALVFLIFRNKRQRLQLEKLEIEQRLLRGQMNPHFVFNSLASLNTFIDNEPDKAKEYLNKFSHLLRGTLELTSESFVSINEEINLIKNYLDIQQLAKPTLFEYNLVRDIINNNIMIPPFLIQPFVENCVKHGFSDMIENGRITITLKEKNQFLNIQIEDNGIGIGNSVNRANKSYSQDIVEKRLKGLERLTNRKAQLSISNKQNEKGTLVVMKIPYLES
ncbi:tetratricopeptide repeat-containing sensor histidine kinase [Spongiivirga citrea]|uniref:Signal transduction histidine kinase internal region domain-containing protein n=1 Tax=Spongiivirga citrea TaxID=1481457 RepID=A0A6M0CH23_9FLAO|nr:histidine kinase [Spongiivirga citrea]NER16782.1 hypothetical protein [Spongiivirga citrea]